MRLEKIILDGFKSFADKTEFVFDTPITAIVGPNGCGKSNVVDAVKWVLGEQSTKSLRSNQMSDVIFSGSSSRKSQSAAQVTMVFSNASRKLGIDTEQVEISRRIFKSGESEYRINKKLCRLKDLREMFMDTGVGVRAYSIIEQGRVEQLLTASKSQRRELFEEAAGISKYKAHKREAERKLDRTDQNLMRLADIVSEVGKQLRSIKLQAGKARNYLIYSERLKELQLNYSMVEYHKVYQQSKDQKEKIGKIEQDFGQISAQLGEQDAKLSNLSEEIITTETQVNQADNVLVSAQSKIEQQKQRIEFLSQRQSELEVRKKQAQERIQKLRANKRQLQLDIENFEDQQKQCKDKLNVTSEECDEFTEKIKVINAQCNDLSAKLEDEKSGIIDIVRRTAQLHNELQSIGTYRDNLSSQKNRLADRAQTSREELEGLLTEKAQNNERLGDVEKVLVELQEKLEDKRLQKQAKQEAIDSDTKRLSSNKESRSALKSELSVLQDMETRQEGIHSAVKNILTKAKNSDKYNYVKGILADIVVADVDYVAAVEAALENKSDTVVVSSKDELFSDSEMIDNLQGRANFICMNRCKPFSDNTDLSKVEGVIGRCGQFVNSKSCFSQLIWSLLGKTIIVDSIETAIKLRDRLDPGFEYVTKEGAMLNSEGTIKLGPMGKSTGLISRKSRLRQLEQTLGNINGEIEQLDQQIADNSQANEHLSNLCGELRTAIYEANTEKTQINSKVGAIEQNIGRLKKEQPLISTEIDQLEEQINKSVKHEYESKQKLDELETVNEQRKKHIASLEEQYNSQRRIRMEQNENLTELKIAKGQLAEQEKSLRQTIYSMQQQLEENEKSIVEAGEDTRSCDGEIERATNEMLGCEARISELFISKEDAQKQSRKLHEKVESLIDIQKQTESNIRVKRAELGDVENRLNELKVQLGQSEVRQQGLVEKVAEQLQIDLVEAYKDYEDSDVDWTQVKSEIDELRGKIDRLGNVNIDAIDEQEELEQRFEFLTVQVEDLNKSKGQLEQLISRLNKQSREKFRESFEIIRVNFQEIFRKLFGGGKSEILLEDSDDILEAGIEIIAQPPGKETRSISLLSGGEKSMTAIALLFAVFKAKPSPFCFLDEVDAALDEANNERFNMIIKEFQKYSQFIIITHAKRTMSIAEVLYGVTMQTRGVSKKISVRFDDYEPQDDSAAVA